MKFVRTLNSFFEIKLTLVILIFPIQKSIAQTPPHKRGEMYAYWGWNRGFYTKSDIRFYGTDYDFTLSDVVAKDRQSPFNLKTYFGLTSFTIPQYNFRFGIYINEKYDLSFGADHMKYVLQNYQNTLINGTIMGSGTKYDGNYNNAEINLDPSFLKFEHTDGLNYENIELRRSDALLHRTKFRIESRVGAGVGFMLPRTNTTLLMNERYDQFHLAGYGVGAVFGLNFYFLNRYFIQFENKNGFIHMPDIRTTKNKSDRASQSFFFSQFNMVFGVSFNTKRKK